MRKRGRKRALRKQKVIEGNAIIIYCLAHCLYSIIPKHRLSKNFEGWG
jgi:hypothetical protein